MSSRQYVIPTKRMTLSDEKDYRFGALATGVVRAFAKNIGEWDPRELGSQPATADAQIAQVKNYIASTGLIPKSLDVRMWRNVDDAVTAVDQWRTAALAAVGTEYSALQAVAAAPAASRATKLVVWHKVSIDQAALNISRVIFRRTNATGILMAQFDVEELAMQEVMQGYFSEPVVWDPNLPYALNVLCRIATGLFDRVIVGGFVFEPAGQTNA